jgi:hypothetical protein
MEHEKLVKQNQEHARGFFPSGATRRPLRREDKQLRIAELQKQLIANRKRTRAYREALEFISDIKDRDEARKIARAVLENP